MSAILLFSQTLPASALGGRQSAPNEGVDQLPGVQEKSEQVLKREPRSRGEVQAEAAEGTNEIQGKADANKMKNPSNSQASESVEQKLEEALENITP
ncbi:MAG: hypothetical protein HC886_00020 [Leptolyngbyaceae cyanobacterium SM1_1_3]|nr:hypothetical protein [Leptolyngbyaceae cyanobacterium SM1_1_3]NJN02033.1 hypothetical protein [Leptolyngbyaceae cyanobacterium RM1_1_2]